MILVADRLASQALVKTVPHLSNRALTCSGVRIVPLPNKLAGAGNIRILRAKSQVDNCEAAIEVKGAKELWVYDELSSEVDVAATAIVSSAQADHGKS